MSQHIKTWRDRLAGLDKPTDFAEAQAAKMEAADLRRYIAELERASQAVDERAAFEAWVKTLPKEKNLSLAKGRAGGYLYGDTAASYRGWQARASIRPSQSGGGEAVKLLADRHTGMRVDYQGLFKQARGALRREPGIAEMLRQFQDHLTELGRRWYAGDTTVVDELLQLYCVERDARASLDGRMEG